jgi:hypothetical protein
MPPNPGNFFTADRTNNKKCSRTQGSGHWLGRVPSGWCCLVEQSRPHHSFGARVVEGGAL